MKRDPDHTKERGPAMRATEMVHKKKKFDKSNESGPEGLNSSLKCSYLLFSPHPSTLIMETQEFLAKKLRDC